MKLGKGLEGLQVGVRCHIGCREPDSQGAVEQLQGVGKLSGIG